MLDLSNYDFVIFDCDGVVLDSNAIKTDGFYVALENYSSDIVEDFISYHKSHGGISRQEKFKYFYNEILGEFNEQAYQISLEKFQTYCVEALTKAPLVKGVEKCLNYFQLKDVPMYILSGGNEKEIRDVFEHKNILKYFKKICGNPISKRQNISYLFNEKIITGKGLYFGDAILDYEISIENKLDFIYVYTVSEWKLGKEFCKAHDVPYIKNFHELIFQN